jgi:hypothetical protein
VLLKISDNDDGWLIFDLRDLVRLIPDLGPRLSWGALSVSNGGFDVAPTVAAQDEDLMDFARQVEDAEAAIPLTWNEVVRRSEQTHQTNWGTYLGHPPDRPLPPLEDLFTDSACYLDRTTATFTEEIELAFQAVDSTYWLVYAKDPAVRRRFKAAFRSVEPIAPEI